MSDEWKDEEPKGSFFSHIWGLNETPEERAKRVEREGRTRAANALIAEHSSPLPPFDADPVCPKCGYTVLSWAYGHHTEAPPNTSRVFERVGFQPHISLTCDRCSYGAYNNAVWVMAPKDTK